MRKVMFVIAGMLMCAQASSSTITLETGQMIEGEIVNRGDDYIEVDIGVGVPTTYYTDEIVSIDGQNMMMDEPSEAKMEDELGEVEDIITKTIATYKSLTYYSSEGKVLSEIDMGNGAQKSGGTFKVKLGRPNLYHISWKNSGYKGSVWNAGDGAILYTSFKNEYESMGSDQMALASATGISGGAANTIPSIFFKFPGHTLSRLQNPVLQGTDTVNGEECFLIQAESAVSHKELVWISKERYLILKNRVTFDDKVKDAYDSDAMIKQLESMENVDEEQMDKLKKTMESVAALQNTSFTGYSEETQMKVETDVELSKADFDQAIPDGVVIKKNEISSMFEGMDMESLMGQ